MENISYWGRNIDLKYSRGRMNLKKKNRGRIWSQKKGGENLMWTMQEKRHTPLRERSDEVHFEVGRKEWPKQVAPAVV